MHIFFQVEVNARLVGSQFTLTESHTVTRSVMTDNECIMAGSAISRSDIILFNVIGWMFLLDMGNEPWMGPLPL
jgi:hypothetical protein